MIAVSSLSGDRGDQGQAANDATKAAVTNIVRSLALDWCPRGVRLDVMAPLVHLDRFDRRSRWGERSRSWSASHWVDPARRDDYVGPVLCLASRGAQYVTDAASAVVGKRALRWAASRALTPAPVSRFGMNGAGARRS